MRAEKQAVVQEARLLPCAAHRTQAALRGGYTHLLYGAGYTLIFSKLIIHASHHVLQQGSATF